MHSKTSINKTEMTPGMDNAKEASQSSIEIITKQDNDVEGFVNNYDIPIQLDTKKDNQFDNEYS